MLLNVLTDTTNEVDEIIQNVEGVDWQKVLDAIINWCTSTGIKLVIGIFVLIIGFRIISFITKRIYKKLHKRGVDETIARVSTQTIRIILKFIILICIVGYVGIETASISACIASLGVGISLAVQGTLSNFAGGVIIIIMRPFRIGAYITSNGESGTVEDIKLFYTHIVTPDNRTIMIPNGALANGVIVNNSLKDTRRVDVVMGVSYSTNIELAKNLISKVCENNSLILKEPKVFVDIIEFGESSIDIVCRAWCKNADYWPVKFYLLNEIKNEFDLNGIEIPFKQIDVNIKASENRE